MSKKGFTLIELLVVIAVLALLASIVFSNLGGAREGARISNALSFQSQTHSLLGSDLVGWWNFNDSSDRYKDLSGYGNNGSCTSCPTPVDGVSGTGGTAMEFNGVDNGLDVSGISKLAESDGVSSPFTISFWANANERQQTYDGFLNVYSTRVNSYEGIIVSFSGSDSTLRVRYWQDGGTNRTWSSPDIIGSWKNIVVTASNNDLTIYQDGTIQRVDPFINPFPFNGDLRIGWYEYQSSYVNSIIDDVRIYSRALTASEVEGLYAQTKGKYLAEE